MKKVRLVLSDAAAGDIIEQAEWYCVQSGRTLATRWETAVTSAIMRLLRRPNAGTPCHFQATELRDLRRISVRGFPKHLVFYKFNCGEVFVLRIVHGVRDLEALL